MDHPFVTRRHVVERHRAAEQLARDVAHIAAMPPGARAHVAARTDALVEDEPLRHALVRHAPRLGVLLDDLASLEYDLTTHRALWSAILRDEAADAGPLAAAATSAAAAAAAAAAELAPGERDGVSSSSSDYTDSDTDSNASDDKSDKTDEETDEETDESDTIETGSSRPKRRRE